MSTEHRSGFAAITQPVTMDEIFSRQIRLAEVGQEGQEKLAKARVLIIGMGGLGTPALQYLSSAGVGAITLLDGDCIDPSNLHRQPLYGFSDIGKEKTEVAARKIKEMHPWSKVRPIHQWITAENVDLYIPFHDLILECTDSWKTKFLVHDACYRHRKPLVMASLYQFEGQLAVYPFDKELKGCLRCLWPVEPPEGCVGTCEEVGILGATAGILGTLQAQVALLSLLGQADFLFQKQILIDTFLLETRKIEIMPRDGCPICFPCEQTIQSIDYRVPLQLEISIPSLEVLNKPFKFIDIREIEEVENEPLSDKIKSNALHIPLSKWQKSQHLLPEEAWVLVCASGKRSLILAEKLSSIGKQDVYSLSGGLS